MRLKFLGTAACEGIPAIFCRCNTCIKSRELGGKSIRTRSQLLIDDDMLIDFPPDSYSHSLANNLSLMEIKYLLITHYHFDHFYPEDLFNRYGELAANTVNDSLNIICPENVKQRLEKIANGRKSSLKINAVLPFKKTVCGNKNVTAFPAQHIKDEDSYIYLIEGKNSVLYATDTDKIDDQTIKFLVNEKICLDALIMDCTRAGSLRDEGRHMNAADNIETVKKFIKLGICTDKTLFLSTHFSHNGGWTHLDAEKNLRAHNIAPAYDGMELLLSGK